MTKPLGIVSIGILLLFGMQSCSVPETHISYCIPELTGEEMQQLADTNDLEYTMFCTYSHYCDFCKEEFPKIFRFCDSLPIQFYVLFPVRAIDSIYIYNNIKEIQAIDSSFHHFAVLSDSLYDVLYRQTKQKDIDKQYRKIEQKSRFGYYRGTIEGNKYINYIEKYIPARFSHECSSPKLILYKKGEGIVFVNRFEIDNPDLTCLSRSDRWKLKQIIYGE